MKQWRAFDKEEDVNAKRMGWVERILDSWMSLLLFGLMFAFKTYTKGLCDVLN